MPRTRVYHAQKPSFWQRQHANLACCREPNLIFAFLPRRESLLSKQDGQNLLPQFRKIICLVGAPAGWIPTVASFPRNDNGGTPTPDCHVERSRNISWKGNDVNCRKIVCLLERASKQADKRTLIQGVLIKVMCLFEVRAARRRESERRA